LPGWSPRGSSSPQDYENKRASKHRGRKREISPFLTVAELVHQRMTEGLEWAVRKPIV
jgi:hypothetical protein